MADHKWLDGYSGESVDQLIALADSHRIDSIVVAMEQALQVRAGDVGLSGLSEPEVTVLAVEAMEREVNNGGYHQFFLNTPEFAPLIVDALRRIACPKTAEISAKAISLVGLRQPFGVADVEKALSGDAGGRLVETLSEECDAAYYKSGEPIADRLFDFVRIHAASVRLA